MVPGTVEGMALTAAERRAWGRIGALTMHARHDAKATSAPGRAAANDRFRREVLDAAAERGDALTEAEVERRAALLRRAWMQRIALKSAAARRRRAT